MSGLPGVRTANNKSSGLIAYDSNKEPFLYYDHDGLADDEALSCRIGARDTRQTTWTTAVDEGFA